VKALAEKGGLPEKIGDFIKKIRNDG